MVGGRKIGRRWRGWLVSPKSFLYIKLITHPSLPFSQGKLNGLAVRVPLTNSSITDCVFEVLRPTTAAEVNAFMKVRAGGGGV